MLSGSVIRLIFLAVCLGTIQVMGFKTVGAFSGLAREHVGRISYTDLSVATIVAPEEVR